MARQTFRSSHRTASLTRHGRVRGGQPDTRRNSVKDSSRAQHTYRQRYHRHLGSSGVSNSSCSRSLIERMTFPSNQDSQRTSAVRGPTINNVTQYNNVRLATNETTTQGTGGSDLFFNQPSETTTRATHAAPQLSTRIPPPARNSKIKFKTSTITNTKPAHDNHGNTYKGKDPIKRAFSNPKLRAILADKPLPMPAKRHNEMALRMGLRDKGCYNL